jgi:hypothetical protein
MRKLMFRASAMILGALFLIPGVQRAGAASIPPAFTEASAARKTETAKVQWRYGGGWRGPGWYGWRPG